MQRTLMLDDRSFSVVQTSAESFCLVCEAALNAESSTNIFYASLPRNGELLASCVLRVLRPVASDLRSSYICSRCNDLFQMLEQAQWTVSNLRSEILKVYRSRDGEKRSERKENELFEGQILTDELFAESDRKNVFDGDRFNQISGFRTLDVQSNENVVRDSAFEDAANDFCNFNVQIDNGVEPLSIASLNGESTVRENRISRVEAPDDAEHDENVARSDSFDHSANNFRDRTDGVDDCVEKSVKPLETGQQSVYEQKYDCLKIEEPIEISDETEAENKSKNCSLSLKKDDDEVHCKICPRVFDNSKDPRSQCLENGDCRLYQCRKCDERFADLSVTNSHATGVHSWTKNCISVAAEPWKNETTEFSGADSLISKESEINEKSEMNNRKNDRGACKSAKVSKYSLKPLKYCCSTCGKKWRTSAELKTHVKSHSNLRPYMCEKCGQAYKHKHALEIHVGMHNGISPYQCSVCNKCFTQKGALMRHLPMHTGEMPYQCELCGKRFVHHTSYNMHALSHTGKKSYQCHVCDLSLLSTSHLKRHMRVHTGEKPFNCELCGKNFAERYNLFAHQKIHDPVEIMAKAAKKITHKCGQCDELFDKKHKLDDHAKEHHSSASNEKNWIGHTVDVENLAKTSESIVDKS